MQGIDCLEQNRSCKILLELLRLRDRDRRNFEIAKVRIYFGGTL